MAVLLVGDGLICCTLLESRFVQLFFYLVRTFHEHM